MPAKKKAAPAAQATTESNVIPTPAPGSALAFLLALSKREPAPAGAPTIVQSMTDPAMQGASKKGSVVRLGLDPAITERARQGAELKAALDNAQAAFSVVQGDLRAYGADKRQVYNGLFKADAVTMAIPYQVPSPGQPNDVETRYVQAICKNAYSINRDVVLGMRDEIGEHFPRLFEETTTKTLKPNAEELIRNLLLEMGIIGEALDATMDGLRDVHVTVKTREDYEVTVQSVPAPVRTILDQAVRRHEPGLKFS